MSKEMIVSCSNYETKIAILEDDQVAELYFERGKEYTLAGSIYKGRVTRVLPGMQSAFVDVGLERDAFLYVSDFFEDAEEYDKIASTVEEKIIRMQEGPQGAASVAPPAAPAQPEAEAPPPAPEQISAPVTMAPPSIPPTQPPPQGSPRRPERPPDRGGPEGEGREGRGRFGRRSRRRRGGHNRGGFPESKYATSQPAPPAPVADLAPVAAEAAVPEPPAPIEEPIILPGESLAKYRSFSPASETRSAAGHAEYRPVEQIVEHTAEPATENVEPAAEERDEPSSALPPLESAAMPAALEPQEEPEPEHFPGVTSWVSIAETEPEEVPPQAWESISKETLPASVEVTEEMRVESHAEPVAAEPEIEAIVPPSELESQESELRAEALAEVDEAPANEVLPTSEESGETTEFAESAESDIEEAIGEEGTGEGSEPIAASAEGAEAAASGQPESGAAERPMPERAAVRDRQRNPRFQRNRRGFAGRREGSREGSRPEQGSRPQGPKPKERQAAPQPLIADLLKEGQEILVQIAKEPLGKKGARITSHIALPGRYLVYMPTVSHVGVSRKISTDEERQRLKRIILQYGSHVQGGFIVRTAGEGHSEEDIRQDIEYLSKLWAEIKTQAETASAPALLHHDLNLVLRIVRDQLSEEFTSVWVDNEQEYERLLSLVSKFQPALINRVKLYTKDVPLFDEMGIQEEINKALKPKVWLKSGGYIVINQTEALVAIDINTGKFVGKSNRLEDTIVRTNVEAVKEIVRQIRLRDLGGIIVIDFIDMDEKKNRQKVMAAMEDALKADRSPSKALAFNEFGLVAITRKRVRQSLERTLCQPCSTCAGSGLVKSVSTVCFEILSEARKIAPEIERKQITLRVNPEVGRSLKSMENTIRQEIEEMTGRPVVIRNDPMLHVEHFDFN